MALSKSELATLKSQWADAEAPSTGELEDGTYQFEVQSATLGKSKAGNLQVEFTYKVIGGAEDAIGEEVTDRDQLSTMENIGWFKRKLKKLGYANLDLDDLETVVELLSELEGVCFEGVAKNKDDFLNIYVNKPIAPIDAEGDGEGDDAGSSEGDDGDGEGGEGDADEDGEGEGDNERAYPELKAIDRMSSKAIRSEILDELEVELPKSARTNKDLLRSMAKSIASVMEDDEYTHTAEALKTLIKAGPGITPAKSLSQMEEQLIDWLNEFAE